MILSPQSAESRSAFFAPDSSVDSDFICCTLNGFSTGWTLPKTRGFIIVASDHVHLKISIFIIVPVRDERSMLGGQIVDTFLVFPTGTIRAFVGLIAMDYGRFPVPRLFTHMT